MSLRWILAAAVLFAAIVVGVVAWLLPGEARAHRETVRDRRADAEQRRLHLADSDEAVISENDPRLMVASDEARAHFGDFRAFFSQHDPGKTCSVELVFPTLDLATDHEWVRVDMVDKFNVSGLLIAEPAAEIGHHAGERVTMPIEKIADWVVRDSSGVLGGDYIGEAHRRIAAQNAESNTGKR